MNYQNAGEMLTLKMHNKTATTDERVGCCRCDTLAGGNLGVSGWDMKLSSTDDILECLE